MGFLLPHGGYCRGDGEADLRGDWGQWPSGHSPDDGPWSRAAEQVCSYTPSRQFNSTFDSKESDMRRRRRAKIVATVGPASASPEMLEALFLAGVDTFRLNFSHGTHDGHANVHAAIRALERDMQQSIGILMDLQGPKIRVGTLRDKKIAVRSGE